MRSRNDDIVAVKQMYLKKQPKKELIVLEIEVSSGSTPETVITSVMNPE